MGGKAFLTGDLASVISALAGKNVSAILRVNGASVPAATRGGAVTAIGAQEVIDD